ncbi:hypothetical protein ACF0H5_021613 [Mactra antiquata]
MFYGKYIVLLIWTLVLAEVSSREVLKCMVCEEAPHIAHCENYETCDPYNQVCYIEEVIDIGGEKVINAGCKDKEKCDSTGCFGESYSRRKRSTTEDRDNNMSSIDQSEVVCHHCCAGDFCNMYGCEDDFDTTDLKGNRCFQCDHVMTPEECATIVNCEEGYICGQEVLALGTERRYNLGCRNKRKCDLLRLIHERLSYRKKRNYIPLKDECCDYHLCNGYSTMLQEPLAKFSQEYICPQKTATANGDTSKISTSVHGKDITTSNKTTSKVTFLPSTRRISIQTFTDRLTKSTTLRPTSALRSSVQISTSTKTYASNHPTAASPSPLIQCEDKSTLCSMYDKETICSRNSLLEWTKINCVKYCDICDIRVELLSDEVINAGLSLKPVLHIQWLSIVVILLAYTVFQTLYHI